MTIFSTRIKLLSSRNADQTTVSWKGYQRHQWSWFGWSRYRGIMQFRKLSFLSIEFSSDFWTVWDPHSLRSSKRKICILTLFESYKSGWIMFDHLYLFSPRSLLDIPRSQSILRRIPAWAYLSWFQMGGQHILDVMSPKPPPNSPAPLSRFYIVSRKVGWQSRIKPGPNLISFLPQWRVGTRGCYPYSRLVRGTHWHTTVTNHL